jgi:hypothetical protein
MLMQMLYILAAPDVAVGDYLAVFPTLWPGGAYIIFSYERNG